MSVIFSAPVCVSMQNGLVVDLWCDASHSERHLATIISSHSYNVVARLDEVSLASHVTQSCLTMTGPLVVARYVTFHRSGGN